MEKIGDKVKIVAKHRFQGKTATIIDIDNGRLGLEFDEYIGGHTCNDIGKDGYCWYIAKEKCDLIEIEDKSFKIKWYKNGKIE